MDPIFEVSEKRLANQREKAENEIKDKWEAAINTSIWINYF